MCLGAAAPTVNTHPLHLLPGTLSIQKPFKLVYIFEHSDEKKLIFQHTLTNLLSGELQQKVAYTSLRLRKLAAHKPVEKTKNTLPESPQHHFSAKNCFSISVKFFQEF